MEAGFSALQRAEIAEMFQAGLQRRVGTRFSALQRAEIAEMFRDAKDQGGIRIRFQCSSTSRNC